MLLLIRNWLKKMNKCNAEEQAAKVLQENEINTYPVDLKKITNKEKIKVQPLSDDVDLSGKIEKQYKEITIWVNRLHSKGRRRFTVAHELGHYYFDIPKSGGKYKDYMFNRSSETNAVEIRANQFAAALLMPQNLLDAAIEKLDINANCISFYNDVYNLAKAFDVSEQAMRFRLTNLGYNIHIP